ncbi:esterase [Bradyrhizobium sp. INPA01-394B]|uniref:Esterase n=1 Tax=Bradyrhizobium campsiandrae TaxID=1729892 RepID=A0ABR7UJD9_9BRAD|nr:esterase [Bradyrhizobium campsiandrae]MBC9876895.1 esterase [Bradyrhizobium campsiandrae]MBC9877044.1 esterase [Bradyrhizobium campsiandrae]MBC9983278.1 esterase [Bradyrhizobium campsiandrae]
MSRLAIASIATLLIVSDVYADEPITLRDMGSFHVGGRLVEISGKPVREVVFSPGGVPAKVDPNGTYQVEQMYVQYFLPASEKGAYPLLMWHGGGLTGVTYETTPDGREGWLNYFLRKGWAVYNSDAVERGRAGWAQYPDIFKGEPVFLTTANPFERFRIGDGPNSYDPDPAKRKVLPGNQFPVERYENFVKQNVPRWTTTDDATIAAYIAEIDRVGPSVILFHSQAGSFGFKVAQARPDKVKALIAIEPAGIGDIAKADALKNIPTLIIYGDYIDRDSRWPKIRANGVAFADAIKAAGGSVDIVDLPQVGIKGNSHMVMMDKNNLVVADLIQKWLAAKGLTK